MSRQRAKSDLSLEEAAANVLLQDDGTRSPPAEPRAEPTEADIVTDVTIDSSASRGESSAELGDDVQPRKKKMKRRENKTSKREWPGIAVGSDVAFVIRLIIMAAIFLAVCILMRGAGRYVVALFAVIVFRVVLLVLQQMGVFGLSDD
jgi:hypothetical protein